MSNDEENVDVDDYDLNDDNNNLALENEVGRTLRHGDAHAEEGEVATREYRSQRLQMCIVNYLADSSASKLR